MSGAHRRYDDALRAKIRTEWDAWRDGPSDGRTFVEWIHDFIQPAWQPIETAPKGGEWFLGYWPECQFSPDRITPTTYCYSCMDGPRFLDAADHRMGQPTHWQPLPTPPSPDPHP